MDLEQQEIVRLAVEDILAGADMENITEKQVRKLAEDETGLDLSHPVGRKLVLSMISAFLDGNGDTAEEEVESEEDDEEKTKKQQKKKKTTKAKKEDRSRREEEEEEKETLAARLTKDKTGRYTEDDKGLKKQHLTKEASQHKKRAFKDDEDEDEDTDGSEEEEERNVKGKKKPKFEKDEQGNIIICELSARRKVIVQQWKGQTLISLREYYEKDGKLLPTSKGISLTVEQFEILAKKIKDIEAAITSIQ